MRTPEQLLRRSRQAIDAARAACAPLVEHARNRQEWEKRENRPVDITAADASAEAIVSLCSALDDLQEVVARIAQKELADS